MDNSLGFENFEIISVKALKILTKNLKQSIKLETFSPKQLYFT